MRIRRTSSSYAALPATSPRPPTIESMNNAWEIFPMWLRSARTIRCQSAPMPRCSDTAALSQLACRSRECVAHLTKRAVSWEIGHGDQVMSAAEVAAALHISRQTVHRYIREGRLRARTIKTGKRGTYQIRRSDFLAFVKRYVRDDWA